MPLKLVGEAGAAALAEAIKTASKGVDSVGEELGELSKLVADAMKELVTSELTAEDVEAMWNS